MVEVNMVDDFKLQYNNLWAQYHLMGRYLDCPDISIENQEKNSHKFNQAELQLGQLIMMAKKYLEREMTKGEIEFGFFIGWSL